MKYKFRKSAWIQTDMETIRNVLISQSFEKDFLPEVLRNPLTNKVRSPFETNSTVSWHNGQETDIALVCTDLNVAIDSIVFRYQKKSDGVLVTTHVIYEKPLEKNFLKAHRAIWSLFSIKLTVLKKDLEGDVLIDVRLPFSS